MYDSGCKPYQEMDLLLFVWKQVCIYLNTDEMSEDVYKISTGPRFAEEYKENSKQLLW